MVCFRDLLPIKKHISDNKFITTGYDHKDGFHFPVIHFLASSPKHPVCEEMIRSFDSYIENKLVHGIQPEWDEISGFKLAHVLQEYPDSVLNMEVSNFSPFDVTKFGVLMEQEDKSIGTYIKGDFRNSYCQSLAFSVRSSYCKSLSEDQILNDQGLIASAFKFALAGFDFKVAPKLEVIKHSSKSSGCLDFNTIKASYKYNLYKIMSKLTFGDVKSRYKKKSNTYKNRLRQMKRH